MESQFPANFLCFPLECPKRIRGSDLHLIDFWICHIRQSWPIGKVALAGIEHKSWGFKIRSFSTLHAVKMRAKDFRRSVDFWLLFCFMTNDLAPGLFVSLLCRNDIFSNKGEFAGGIDMTCCWCRRDAQTEWRVRIVCQCSCLCPTMREFDPARGQPPIRVCAYSIVVLCRPFGRKNRNEKWTVSRWLVGAKLANWHITLFLLLCFNFVRKHQATWISGAGALSLPLINFLSQWKISTH